MALSFTEWQDKLKGRWRVWQSDPKGTLNQIGANSLYFALAGTALYPIAAAVAHGDLAALGLLYSLGAGVGVNLISNAVQQWADESDAAQGLVDIASQHAELSETLDAILGQLDALSEVRSGLSQADREWFLDTFRDDASWAGSHLVIEI